jgi:hypothetical protein
MSAPDPTTPDPQQSGGLANQAALATLQIVQSARQLAMQFPQVAPLMRQVNDLMQQAQMKISQQADSGQTPAPPIG